MSWDDRWMAMAQLVATWSKDRSTKVGAVIVDSRNVVLSLGWNGFPRGVTDNVDTRHERPTKYLYTEHAERNAIYNAAANGTSLAGSSMYIDWFPCTDCARAIIQSGISSVVCKENPSLDVHKKWNEDFKISKEMLEEAGVEIQYYVRTQDSKGVPK